MLKVLFYFILQNTILSGLFWTLVLVYFTAKVAITFAKRFIAQSKFPALIKQRREECDRTFQFEVSKDELSESLKNEILNSDIEGLKKIIWSQKASSEQVLKFFFYRSKTIGRELNAAIEANFEQALKLAKKSDQLIKTSKQEDLPELCGVPFSVKENYKMEGFETNNAVETLIGHKEKETSLIVTELIKRGAIPFVRSNIPQLLMAAESANSIYGTAKNPHDHKRTPGGSSGGEGALIASGCSPFGIGNDIAGSIRIPAHFTGLFGFKPCPVRTTTLKNTNPASIDCAQYSHQTTIRVANGPLGKSVEDLKLVSSVILQKSINHEIEPHLPPIDWRPEASVFPKGQKLTIGYFDSVDSVFESCPAVRRAVKEVVASLKAQGHTLVEMDTAPFKEMFSAATKILLADGNVKKFMDFGNGIQAINAYKNMQIVLAIPQFIRTAIREILNRFGPKNSRIPFILETLERVKSVQYMALGGVQGKHQYDFLKSLTSQNISFIICPNLGLPACHHGESGELFLSACTTMAFNYLGMPSGTLPITRVKKDEQNYPSQYADPVTEAAKKAVQGSEGLPVGVQVVGLPYKDEETLAFMQHIEEIMQLKPFLKL